MSATEILVIGSIHQDLVIRGPRLPQPGETVLGGQFYQVAGGKGANQAVACRRAGNSPVWLIAAVGTDLLGNKALDELEKEGLETQSIQKVADQATGVALILVAQDGENCISVASGANASLQSAHFPATSASIWSPGNYLLASLEVPWQTVAAGLAQARACKMTTILNPAPAAAALREQLNWQNVDIITPNAQEASLLTGSEVVDVPSALQASAQLLELGCLNAIVTLGKQGLVLRQAETVLHLPAHPVTAIDTTAAGDCFNGALVAALASGKELPKAVAWANLAAGLSVQREGAQPSLPSQQEIEQTWQKTDPDRFHQKKP